MDDDLTWDEAWAQYFAAHPEVLAAYGHQNGSWPPRCFRTQDCPLYDGHFDECAV